MIITTICYGAVFSGVYANHTDIAPSYAGLLMGICNALASIPGFTIPSIIGSLTHGVPGLAPWHTVFYITSGLLFLEFLIFTFFASVEEQPWNQDHREELKLRVKTKTQP